LREVNRHGWQRKSWLTRDNRMVGGGAWDKNNLYNLLTNIAYTGRVSYGGEIYPGEHEALLSVPEWEDVQSIMKSNGKSGTTRNPTDAALRGILYCSHCNVPMLHTFTTKNKTRRYRYYMCMRAQKRGPESCPTCSLPAGEIEGFVAGRIRAIGDDTTLLTETVAKVRAHAESESRKAEQRLADANAVIRKLQSEVAKTVGDPAALESIAAKLREAENESQAAEAAVSRCRAATPSEEHIRGSLKSFAPLWDAMTAAERARSLSLILERVSYDAAGGTLALTFRPGGFRSLSPTNEENHHAN